MNRLLLHGLIATGLAPVAATSHATAIDPYAYIWEVTSEEDSIPLDVDRRFTRAWHRCQDHAVSTRDNVECFNAEFDRQDAALNRTWHVTLRRWPAARHTGLLEAQRAWAARRDTFCREKADEYSGGTIMPIIFVSCQVEVTIRRTIWLEKLR
jgi:uncharacterized protein YecT (DUF1311 family)